MNAVTPFARGAVGLALLVFGLQHLIYGDFVTRVAPKLSAAANPHQAGAYLTGALLVIGGAAILYRGTARMAGLLLGAAILASFLLLYLPLLTKTQFLGALWTNARKALALSGAALLAAGSAPRPEGRSGLLQFLEHLIPAAPYFLGAFLILTGIQHFLFAKFVATLVPTWIPGAVFWTYFAGVALIAGGLGMMIPFTRRLAAALTAIMIFLWLLLLHIPRALAAPADSNETTAVFEALAISAAAFLVADRAHQATPLVNK